MCNRLMRFLCFFVAMFFVLSCGSKVDDINEGIINESLDQILSNKNLVRNYVDKLIDFYLKKMEQSKNMINEHIEEYKEEIKVGFPIITTKEVSYDIINRYLTNSDSITPEEWKMLQDTRSGEVKLKGYNKSSDDNNYDNDKKQVEDLRRFSQDVLKQDYRMSLIENDTNLGLGLNDKAKYRVILNTPEANHKFDEYAERFRSEAELLDQGIQNLNVEFENAVNIVNKNRQDLDNNLLELHEKKKLELQTIYNRSLHEFEDFLKNNEAKVGIYIGSHCYNVIFKYTTNYTDLRPQAYNSLQLELSAIDKRVESIRKNIRLSDSKMPSKFTCGTWEKLSPEEREVRLQRIDGDRTNRVGHLGILSDIDARISTRGEKNTDKDIRIYRSLEFTNTSEMANNARRVAQQFIEGKISQEDMLGYFMGY